MGLVARSRHTYVATPMPNGKILFKKRFITYFPGNSLDALSGGVARDPSSVSF